eukprot:1159314-Pelagomonas_calceolata.AAC.3
MHANGSFCVVVRKDPMWHINTKGVCFNSRTAGAGFHDMTSAALTPMETRVLQKGLQPSISADQSSKLP